MAGGGGGDAAMSRDGNVTRSNQSLSFPPMLCLLFDDTIESIDIKPSNIQYFVMKQGKGQGNHGTLALAMECSPSSVDFGLIRVVSCYPSTKF